MNDEYLFVCLLEMIDFLNHFSNLQRKMCEHFTFVCYEQNILNLLKHNEKLD